MATIDLTPESVDLVLYAGDGASFTVTAEENGQPLVLDGEIHACVRADRTTANLADFAVDQTECDKGIIKLSLSGEQTAFLLGDGTKFSGVWDCQWQAGGAEPKTLVQGKVTCNIDVTRSDIAADGA